MPYLNLKTELKKTNITNEEIAHVLRLRTEDVLDKLEGSGRFTIGEAMLLKKRYFSGCRWNICLYIQHLSRNNFTFYINEYRTFVWKRQ